MDTQAIDRTNPESVDFSRRTAADIRELVLGAYDRLDGPARHWVVEGPVAQGKEAIVFRARCETATPPIVAIKQWRKLPTRPDRLARMFQNHVAIHARMSTNEEFRIPQPLAVMPEQGCMLMEWIEGHTLAQTIGGPMSEAERDGILTSVGRWLRHFHGRDLDFRKFDSKLELQWTRGKLDSYPSKAFGRRGIAKGLTVLEANVDKVHGQLVPHVILHGDLNLINLIVDRDRIVGIDISRHRTGCFLYDLLHFSMRFGFKSRVEYDTWIASRRFRDFNTMLDAYQEGKPVCPEPVIYWMQLANLLVCTQQEHQKRWPTLALARRGLLRLRYLRRMSALTAAKLIAS